MFHHADVVCCMDPVAILNTAFCMTYSLLMMADDERGGHMDEGNYGRNLLDGGPCYEH